jgi:transposase
MTVARAGYAAGHPKLEDLWMSQTVAALIPAAVDYERTLVLAIELSNKSWVLAAQVPGLPHTKASRTVNPQAEALLAAIAGYRARAGATGAALNA